MYKKYIYIILYIYKSKKIYKKFYFFKLKIRLKKLWLLKQIKIFEFLKYLICSHSVLIELYMIS